MRDATGWINAVAASTGELVGYVLEVEWSGPAGGLDRVEGESRSRRTLRSLF